MNPHSISTGPHLNQYWVGGRLDTNDLLVKIHCKYIAQLYEDFNLEFTNKKIVPYGAWVDGIDTKTAKDIIAALRDLAPPKNWAAWKTLTSLLGSYKKELREPASKCFRSQSKSVYHAIDSILERLNRHPPRCEVPKPAPRGISTPPICDEHVPSKAVMTPRNMPNTGIESCSLKKYDQLNKKLQNSDQNTLLNASEEKPTIGKSSGHHIEPPIPVTKNGSQSSMPAKNMGKTSPPGTPGATVHPSSHAGNNSLSDAPFKPTNYRNIYANNEIDLTPLERCQARSIMPLEEFDFQTNISAIQDLKKFFNKLQTPSEIFDAMLYMWKGDADGMYYILESIKNKMKSPGDFNYLVKHALVAQLLRLVDDSNSIQCLYACDVFYEHHTHQKFFERNRTDPQKLSESHEAFRTSLVKVKDQFPPGTSPRRPTNIFDHSLLKAKLQAKAQT